MGFFKLISPKTGIRNKYLSLQEAQVLNKILTPLSTGHSPHNTPKSKKSYYLKIDVVFRSYLFYHKHIVCLVEYYYTHEHKQ